MVLAVVAVALVIGTVVAFVLLSLVALFLYNWRILFPLARSIAEWTTNRLNFLPFVNFMLLLIIPTGTLFMIWLVLYAYTDHIAFIILALLLIPILAIELIIFIVPLVLAFILWIMRLCHFVFARFRTWFLMTSFKLVMMLPRRLREGLLKRLE